MANLCRVENLSKLLSNHKDLVEVYKKIFPVVIFISPEASSNNIKRYIADHYSSYIEPIQKEFRKPKIRIKGKRTKNAESRKLYDRIYQLKNLSHKVIYNNLKREFPNRRIPEVWEMSKAISLASSRRN